jgi:hypothetical protein
VRASAALLIAVTAAATLDPKPCPACADPANAGLCHSEKCRAQVLPQLREPSIKVDAHSGKYYEPLPARAEQTTASDHATRMARQSERQYARLGRSMLGQFTTRNSRRGRR